MRNPQQNPRNEPDASKYHKQHKSGRLEQRETKLLPIESVLSIYKGGHQHQDQYGCQVFHDHPANRGLSLWCIQ